ncbi:uncharacterized protein LOC135388433 [Ornithodoros turicata]|uniref:uncharacterized protein LOC135388433 n=1 Tax=Ornithodoros turicata TaxID=34597 RepID=UPI003138F092
MAATSQSGSPTPVPRKRFTTADDLYLLREVVFLNPFENGASWTDVVRALNLVTGKTFTVRGARERTALLMSLFKKQDRINLRKSGTEEQFEEKERLLQEVVDLQKEFGERPIVKHTKAAATAQATRTRNEALSCLLHQRREGELSEGGTPEKILLGIYNDSMSPQDDTQFSSRAPLEQVTTPELELVQQTPPQCPATTTVEDDEPRRRGKVFSVYILDLSAVGVFLHFLQFSTSESPHSSFSGSLCHAHASSWTQHLLVLL